MKHELVIEKTLFINYFFLRDILLGLRMILFNIRDLYQNTVVANEM